MHKGRYCNMNRAARRAYRKKVAAGLCSLTLLFSGIAVPQQSWIMGGTVAAYAASDVPVNATKVDISTLSIQDGKCIYIIEQDGDYHLTGSNLRNGVRVPTQIQVAEGVHANLYLDNVDINNEDGQIAKSGSGEEDVASTVPMNISGETVVYLVDDSTMKTNVNHAVDIAVDASMTIEEGGKLTVSGQGGHKAGIKVSGMLLVNGGEIQATGGYSAPGLGFTEATDGRIVINGGKVKGTGGSYAAGIGAGDELGFSNGQIEIHGGEVCAEGGYDAAGIGRGDWGSVSSVLIDGGTIEASGPKGGIDAGDGKITVIKGGFIKEGTTIASGTKDNDETLTGTTGVSVTVLAGEIPDTTGQSVVEMSTYTVTDGSISNRKFYGTTDMKMSDTSRISAAIPATANRVDVTLLDRDIPKGYTMQVSGGALEVLSSFQLHKITYEVSGNAVGTAYSKKDGTVDVPAQNPVREGYDFLGWYIGSTPVTETTVLTGDAVAIATFRETVAHAKGRLQTLLAEAVAADGQLDEQAYTTASYPAYKEAWNAVAAAANVVLETQTEAVEDIWQAIEAFETNYAAAKAKLTEADATAHLVYGAGTDAVTSEAVRYASGDAVELTAEAAGNGYVFRGWYRGELLDGSSVPATKNLSASVRIGTEDVTYQAVYARIPEITAPELVGTYGDKVSELVISGGAATVTAQGAQAEAVAGTWKLDENEETKNQLPQVKDTDSYTLTFVPEDALYYEKVSVEVIPQIAPKKITVTIKDASRNEGEENPTFAYETLEEGVLAGSDKAEDLNMVLSCAAVKASKAGSYPITGSYENDNYSITFVNGTLTVKKDVTEQEVYARIPEITAPELVGTYGDKVSELVISGGAATVTAQGAQAEAVAGTWKLDENEETKNQLPQVKDTDSYTLTFVPEDALYYEKVSVEVIPQIAPKKITVTIKDASKNEGEENPAFTYEALAEGVLEGSDKAADLNIALSCAAVKASKAGSYPITGSYENDNYNITFVNGTLTVKKVASSVTYGDLVGDDGVNLRDAKQALRFALGIDKEPTEEQNLAGDVMDVGDGIRLRDAKAILKRALNIPVVFDVEK